MYRYVPVYIYISFFFRSVLFFLSFLSFLSYCSVLDLIFSSFLFFLPRYLPFIHFYFGGKMVSLSRLFPFFSLRHFACKLLSFCKSFQALLYSNVSLIFSFIFFLLFLYTNGFNCLYYFLG